MKARNKNKLGKSARQNSAKNRQAVYDKLSPGDKLAALDIKFGLNAGAIRQRIKLNKQITVKKEEKKK